MKKSRLAVATLLAAFSVAAIVPVAFAEEPITQQAPDTTMPDSSSGSGCAGCAGCQGATDTTGTDTTGTDTTDTTGTMPTDTTMPPSDTNPAADTTGSTLPTTAAPGTNGN
ncbi:MAG: hypothetical protein NXI01_05545 [Gammaproteobacteria bacterium]|nr:hypothetical protein [Gammaproteobacteria bacterium]